jgi:SAM-dependent methyltransferase
VTRAAIAAAYSRSASAWAAGADHLYRALGEAMAAHLGADLTGRLVLDVGAGTGALGAALRRRGAAVVELDAARGMLAYDRARRPPGVVADATTLPFRPLSFRHVVAGCCLSHVDDPVAAVRAMIAVLRPSGSAVASAFPAAWVDPTKAAVESVLGQFGWTAPDWYPRLREGPGAALVGSAAGLQELARRAGARADVGEVVVAVRFTGAEQVIAWRFGMAHVAPFVGTLPAAERSRLTSAAVDALAAGPVVIEVPLLLLTCFT